MSNVVPMMFPIGPVLEKYPLRWVAFVVSPSDYERGYMIARSFHSESPKFRKTIGEHLDRGHLVAVYMDAGEYRIGGPIDKGWFD